jgi:hypothetical protein
VQRNDTQGRQHKALAAALLQRGADLGSKAAVTTKEALVRKDDLLLAALIGVVKQSVLDTLDINFRNMEAASLPKAAAACASREASVSSHLLCLSAC